MKYRIVIVKTAEHNIKKLPNQVQKKIVHTLFELAENPRPRGVKKLKGPSNLYRLRVGNYRIIYSIKDDELIIVVVKVGSRNRIYQNIKNAKDGIEK